MSALRAFRATCETSVPSNCSSDSYVCACVGTTRSSRTLAWPSVRSPSTSGRLPCCVRTSTSTARKRRTNRHKHSRVNPTPLIYFILADLNAGENLIGTSLYFLARPPYSGPMGTGTVDDREKHSFDTKVMLKALLVAKQLFWITFVYKWCLEILCAKPSMHLGRSR